MSSPIVVPAAPPAPIASSKTEIPIGQMAPVFRVQVPSAPAVAASAGPLRLSVQHSRSSFGDLSEVAGSVTDASGAAIPRANVTLRQLADASGRNTQTDEGGRFRIAALPPGRYDLQISAPGFQKTSGQVELGAQDLAMVSSVLPVGAAAETVEVTAASPVIQTAQANPRAESQIVLKSPADLPIQGRNPTALALLAPGVSTTTTLGKLMLTVNAAGAVSLSKDAGKHWKAVKQPWSGKVVQLSTRAKSPSNPETFQVTTDSGSVWLSRDGVHWYPDSP
jgi:hypothetical protein